MGIFSEEHLFCENVSKKQLAPDRTYTSSHQILAIFYFTDMLKIVDIIYACACVYAGFACNVL